MAKDRIPSRLRLLVITKCNSECVYCHRKGFLDSTRPGLAMLLEKRTYKKILSCADDAYVRIHRTMHVDHVIPESRGGKTEFDNLVVACEACNENKRAKTPDEWNKGKLNA